MFADCIHCFVIYRTILNRGILCPHNQMDEDEYESQGWQRAMPCGPTFSHRDNELDEDKEEVPPVQERP
jgi:hypothetical protein